MQHFSKLIILIISLDLLVISCLSKAKTEGSYETSNLVHVIGALRDVMQRGELQGRIQLDTIANQKGLYGLGPEAFLTGELLVYDGTSYVSRVQADSSITVERTYDIAAPFFVYTYIKEWKEFDLPDEVRTILDLEQHLEKNTLDIGHAFAYRLTGTAKHAVFHIQNLPKGTAVSSPEEAHQGQINYELIDEEVEILGFFSKEHKGIFTHHDSYVHMHVITQDKTSMGHLDELEIGNMKLFLPQE